MATNEVAQGEVCIDDVIQEESPAAPAAEAPKPKMKNGASHHVSLDGEVMNHLSAEDQALLRSMDKVGAGRITVNEICAEVHACKDANKNMSRLFKIFGLAVLILVFLLGGTTAATFAVVEGTKEDHVKGDNLVSATDGGEVQTANEDMAVDASGVMTAKKAARRLDGTPGSVKTAPSLEKVELASSLPDKTLMGLDELTVYSDKGHTLQIQVNGFSRVPVLNSNCGNVVHFYTAWKGRITLDSKDLSFDPVTAKEFENAGFSVAVGGISGRRLAGTSKTDGFFKNMEDMAASGKWKCAGVPLPTMSEHNVVRQSNYQPCGAVADPNSKKNKMDMCDSMFGGQLPGAAQLEQNLALAVVSKTKAIAAQLKKETPKAIYVKTEAIVMKSAKYSVRIESYPAHFNQELISITDVASNTGVQFQNVKSKGRTHCRVEQDPAAKAASGAPKKDSEMHFEFLGTDEENGKVLRHFRMMTSAAFNTYMGDGGQKPADSYTEFWDVAETLVPYRLLSGDGSLTVFDSIVAKCSDADIQTELSKRLTGNIANLLTCTDDEKLTDTRPDVGSPYLDLDMQGADYYVQHVFVTEDDMQDIVKDEKDQSAKAKFARYLTNVKNLEAMPDFCKQHCKTAWAAYNSDQQNGVDACVSKSLPELLLCLESSQMVACETAPFVPEQRTECDANGTPDPNGRRLEDVSAKVQEELAEEFGSDAVQSARLVFNSTETYLPAASEPLKSRNLIGVKCTSKMGRIKWMGDGWCMKWKFAKFGFSLQLKFGRVMGKIGVAIVCKACVPILLVFSIPPPLVCKMCVGGVIACAAKKACPSIPLTISGKVFFSVSCSANFGIISITIAKIEIGVFGAVSSFKKEKQCWWNCGNGGGRRRYWSRRRRNTRACNYDADCDIKVGAYAEITLAVVKARLDLTYWVKNKTMVSVLTISCYEVWKLGWGGWKKMWSKTVFKYKF